MEINNKVKVIAYEIDGHVHICNPAPDDRRVKFTIEDDENVYLLAHRDYMRYANTTLIEMEPEHLWLKRIQDKDVPDNATNIHIIEQDAVPTDRTFRNALRLSDGKLDHNMDKAREIHRRKLRALRKPLLAELDIAYQRADEVNDEETKKDIVFRKTQLRNVTDHPGIDGAETPEDLKAIIPEVLITNV
jgi:hypothetical protein